MSHTGCQQFLYFCLYGSGIHTKQFTMSNKNGCMFFLHLLPLLHKE